MSLGLTIADLSNLNRIDAAMQRNDPRGQFARLGMKEVIVADNVLELLPEALARQLVAAGKPASGAVVCVVVDPVRILRAGRDLKADVIAALERTHRGRLVEDRKSTRLNSSHNQNSSFLFFFNDTAPTEIYTLSLHDALPIWCASCGPGVT